MEYSPIHLPVNTFAPPPFIAICVWVNLPRITKKLVFAHVIFLIHRSLLVKYSLLSYNLICVCVQNCNMQKFSIKHIFDERSKKNKKVANAKLRNQ
jgi:hypothetical protein